MLLKNWKDGSRGHSKALVAAFVDAISYAGLLGIATLLIQHVACGRYRRPKELWQKRTCRLTMNLPTKVSDFYQTHARPPLDAAGKYLYDLTMPDDAQLRTMWHL